MVLRKTENSFPNESSTVLLLAGEFLNQHVEISHFFRAYFVFKLLKDTKRNPNAILHNTGHIYLLPGAEPFLGS